MSDSPARSVDIPQKRDVDLLSSAHDCVVSHSEVLNMNIKRLGVATNDVMQTVEFFNPGHGTAS
jgi:hypothetical protein